jgi:hypothetical protein
MLAPDLRKDNVAAQDERRKRANVASGERPKSFNPNEISFPRFKAAAASGADHFQKLQEEARPSLDHLVGGREQ